VDAVIAASTWRLVIFIMTFPSFFVILGRSLCALRFKLFR
jgi:hypothetical protein